MSEVKPGYVFNFQADLGSGKAIQVTGNFPVNASKELIDAELDKVGAALSRQQAKLAIVVIENQIRSAQSTLDALLVDREKLDSKYKGKNLPTGEQAARDNMDSSVRQLSAKIKQLNSDLDSVKKEAK